MDYPTTVTGVGIAPQKREAIISSAVFIRTGITLAGNY